MMRDNGKPRNLFAEGGRVPSDELFSALRSIGVLGLSDRNAPILWDVETTDRILGAMREPERYAFWDRFRTEIMTAQGALRSARYAVDAAARADAVNNARKPSDLL